MKRALCLFSVIFVYAVLMMATRLPRDTTQHSDLPLQTPRISAASWSHLRSGMHSSRLISVMFRNSARGGNSESSDARRFDYDQDKCESCGAVCRTTDQQCRNNCTSQHPPSLYSSALYDCWKSCDAVMNSCNGNCDACKD
jgi:hypothetical protein